MCDPSTLSLLNRYGINPNTPGLFDRIRPPDNPAPPAPERERVVNPDPLGEAGPAKPVIPQPTISFVAPPPATAQDLSKDAAAKAAPQALGGLAASFTTPTGKQGYSKSLRPESGRLIR